MEGLFNMSYIFTHANSILSIYFFPTESSAVWLRVRLTPSQTESANTKDDKAVSGQGVVDFTCWTCFHHAANGTRTKQMNYVTNNYESFQETKETLQWLLVTKRQGSLNNAHNHLGHFTNHSLKQ